MALSAAFTVEGAANPARHSVAYGATVDLAITSLAYNTITWSIVGTSKSTEPTPTITLAGTPTGSTASFPMPADPGDGLGRSFRVKCRVTDSQGNEAVQYAIVGALNQSSRLPIPVGEEVGERHATYGWTDEVNEALAGGAINPTAGSLIRVHQEYASTVAHYRMQDTTAEADVLLDSTANAQHITKDSGGNNFPTGVFPGGVTLTRCAGLTFAYLSPCRHDVAATATYLQGAMTCVLLGNRQISAFSNAGWVHFGLAGQNTQYAFETKSDGTLRYWHHHGAQVVDECFARWFPPPGIFWMGFTRTAGGVIQFWGNGKKIGPPSSALTMPTAGTGAKFHFVNNNAGGVTSMPSYMASCRIDNVVLSDATLKADYNHTLGGAYGYAV